ncbi:hypothetical protein JAAARDRAFT_336603 [Jaapia argillacea MUCL 33604]|uniref:nitric oxide dioxygenase n=1 Tax=Jaapia argillacea MUCL 33604 TaxID=933084 RepID=A0A067PKQ2_9AGAM|nr:hypothetical protein JAAARDRAFT_336603 [Jaapia argillacea MUCL 33604]
MTLGCQATDLPKVVPLTDAQRKLVKATAPILAQHGETVTAHFYQKMLDHHPELQNVFNHTSQVTNKQPAALAAAVYAYAVHIDDLTPVLPVVEHIAHKHVTLDIQPSQYNIVGTHLLGAIQDILGDAFTPDLFDAWYAAYWQLANILINRERELYEGAKWAGWKSFKLEKRVKESEEVTSFYLVPEESSLLPLPEYKAGQYISVRKFVPKLGIHQCRQYSLSDTPNPEHFRISVKRELGAEGVNGQHDHPGSMSNLIHDTLQVGDTIDVAAPFGDFFIDSNPSPIVLISAGVGITPAMSMLNTIFSQKDAKSQRTTSWIHTAHNRSKHPFREHVRALAEKNPEKLRQLVFYSEPDVGSVKGQDYHLEGRADLGRVPKANLYLDDKASQYYVVGPVSFMADIHKGLVSLGVESDRVHMELYGTGSIPVAA